jgi:hypothetical protein
VPLQGLQVGADALMSQPFRMNEVIARSRSLVDMAGACAPLALRWTIEGPGRSPRGNIENVHRDCSPSSRWSSAAGELKLACEPMVATIDLGSGYASGGTINGRRKNW